jgi:beta-lactamase superfamily II metal-dependent hydrolase
MNLNVPQYNGIEVDMLSLGDADSILVTNWVNGVPQRVLIDGGNKEDSEKVCQFLLQRGARYIDHVVCSHPHDDHAAGLVEIIGCKHLTFGHAWMHLPWQHIDQRTLANALAQSKASRVVRIINASLQTRQAILKAIQSRGIPLSKPFKGQHVGFMFTFGPSKEYYEELLKEFSDLEKLERFEEALAAHERSLMVEELWKGSIVGGKASESKESAVLGGAPTEPENNSATVLFTKWGNDQCLFTSDAGVPALDRVKKAYALANLRWLQIPHHGSRRNINHDLI